MENRLPEKLTALRKYYGYAQADIAEKLEVDLSEYLNWENGNSIGRVHQLKKLADLYHIPLEELIDNTREVTLPKASSSGTDEVEIPFLSSFSTPTRTTADVSNGFSQTILPIETAEDQQEDLGTTRQADLNDLEEEEGATRTLENPALAETAVNHIVDDDEEDYEDEAEEEPVRKRPPQKKKKFRLNKKSGIIIGVVAAAVVVAVLFLTRGISTSIEVALSDVNRLALGDGYSLYLRSEGDLSQLGDAQVSLSSQDLVQVSASSSFALGLKKDGTVVCSGSGEACAVDDWNQITMIAAGNNHSVGLKDDGTVVCTGSTTACAVEDWTDVTAVYAGDDVTVGIDSSGSLLIAGTVNNASDLTSLSGLQGAGIGSNQLAVINESGGVDCYVIGSGSASDTSSWSGVSKVVVGDNFVAGLASGSVLIATTDEDMEEEVSSWSNVKFIAANGATLIAVDSSGNVIGVGDNSYHVYGSTSATASATAASTQLDQVSNVQFTVTAANMSILWDGVQDADYYTVSVSTGTSTVSTVNSQKTSASVSADKLVDGTTYTITITACSQDDAIEDSEPLEVTYTYAASTIKLDTPGNIKAVESSDGTKVSVSWNAVANAGSYEVALSNGYTQTVTTNSASLDAAAAGLTDGDYSLTVVAMPASGQTRYTQSDSGSATFTYTKPATPTPTAQALAAPSISTVISGQTVTVNWSTVAHASSYTVTVVLPDGSRMTSPITTSTSLTPSNVTFEAGETYTIEVTANPESASYTASTGSTSITMPDEAAATATTTAEG
jgi:transcriptional regulator with XRE-family HTH domain